MMPDTGEAAQEGYSIAAPLYWEKTWRGILPIRRGCKKTPPAGYTGETGDYPSYPDLLAWAELYPDGNLCLRMPDDVIGIDIDAYGAKTGGQAFTEAQTRWGNLTPTVRSTSRDDGISGIRFYRVPPGTRLAEGIEFDELGIGDIQIVQRRHRYAMAWPSLHPEGRRYQWLDDQLRPVDIPRPDQLPELPPAWIDALPAKPRTTILHNAVYNIRDALTAGELSAPVVMRLRQAIKELNLPGQSRHDTARGHVLALLRLGKTGEPGIERALIALGEMFIALITPDRAGGKDEATREYQAMVTGPGAATQLAQPSITDWIHHISHDTILAAATPPSTPRELRSRLETIEHGFWRERESLTAVYTTALARMSSPWAVLAHTIARGLTLIPAHIVLPALIGGPGSLNWFAAICAASGGGKGASAACARHLIPHHVETRPLGSGEGIIAAYGQQDSPDALAAILFTADETDTITALSNRVGSTTMSVLRSAFSGEGLGFSYAAKDKRYRLDAGQYRFTLAASVQPARALGLLGDGGGGTPQRFMWFPGIDARITADVPWEANCLTLPNLTEWLYPITLTIPIEAEQHIRGERVKAMHGETGALDGHAIFCREKFAYGLTVIDGRSEMTSTDWELSGIAAQVSEHTRDAITGVLQESAALEAEDRGRLLGVANEAADLERALRRSERTGRVLRWLLKALDEAGGQGMTKRDLSRKVAGRDRPLLDTALIAAVDDGLIGQMEGRWVKR